MTARTPKRFRDATLDDFEIEIPKLKKGSTGFFISGPVGVGKTHLAAALVRKRLSKYVTYNESMERYESSSDVYTFSSSPRFLTEIRATFGQANGQNQNQIVEAYAQVKILILDDLGAEKITDWSSSTLYDLISWRDAEMRDTVVTSNLDIEQIAEWEPRIASRLSGMEQIILTGMDWRG